MALTLSIVCVQLPDHGRHTIGSLPRDTLGGGGGATPRVWTREFRSHMWICARDSAWHNNQNPQPGAQFTRNCGRSILQTFPSVASRC